MAVLDRQEERRFLADELERVEAQLAATDQFEAINEALKDCLILTGHQMSEESATRWLQVALTRLAREPTAALAEALDDASRRCRWPNDIVPFVTARCEEWKAPLRRHLLVLRTIAAAADVG